jgi:CheY-like chemotaxis protein
MATQKILLIEDDADIRNSLQEILEFEKMEVVVADNGQKGLQLLGSHSDFNVILLDMMMPVMDGWEFLEKVKANPKWSAIPVIAISAARMQAAPVEEVFFLKKPLDLDMLLDTIQRLCV